MLLIPTISIILLFIDQIASEKLSILTNTDETGSIWPYSTHNKQHLQDPQRNSLQGQRHRRQNHQQHHNRHRNRHSHKHQLDQLQIDTNEIAFSEEEPLKLDPFHDDHRSDEQSYRQMDNDNLFGDLEPFFLSSENNRFNQHEQGSEQAETITITTTATPLTITTVESKFAVNDDLVDLDESSLLKLPPFLQDIITNHLKQTKHFLSYQQPKQHNTKRTIREQISAKTAKPQTESTDSHPMQATFSTNDADVSYSKIIKSSPNNLLLSDYHQNHHLGHLSRITTAHREPLSRYASNGLNSFIVAVLIGLGVTGTLLVIVNHKMRTFKSRLISKQHRRSLVPNIVDCN